MEKLEYAGFWIRSFAAFIDTFIMSFVLLPVAFLLFKYDMLNNGMSFGLEILLHYIMPALIVIIFWIWKSATPGKSLLGLKILDATTGNEITPTQAILRYSGYFVAILPFLIGIFWVGFDSKKQGWHDKIANTIVVKITKEVEF
jgi:uncharacterized RDD family membrane protein YckC